MRESSASHASQGCTWNGTVVLLAPSMQDIQVMPQAETPDIIEVVAILTPGNYPELGECVD